MSSTAFCPNLKMLVITYGNAHTISHYLRMSTLSWNKTLYIECCSIRMLLLLLLVFILFRMLLYCPVCICHISLKNLLCCYLLSDKFDGVFIFHTKLNQRQSHQHWRPITPHIRTVLKCHNKYHRCRVLILLHLDVLVSQSINQSIILLAWPEQQTATLRAPNKTGQEQHIDTCLYAWYHLKMSAINSVFDFEPETAESSLESYVGVAVFRLFSGVRYCKISAHLVQ